MQHLIEDLRACSKEDAENTLVSDEVLSEAALLTAVTALEQSIISHDPGSHLATNELQLFRVFQDLIGNAIKYCRDPVARVHVSGAAEGERDWPLAVRNSGIAERHFPRIFVLFQHFTARRNMKEPA